MKRKINEIFLIVGTSAVVLSVNIFICWVMVKAVIIVAEKIGENITAEIKMQSSKNFFDVWDEQFIVEEEKEYPNCYKLNSQHVPSFASFAKLEKVEEIEELTNKCVEEYKNYKEKDERILAKMKQFFSAYKDDTASFANERAMVLRIIELKEQDVKYQELDAIKTKASLDLDKQIGVLYKFLRNNFAHYKIDEIKGILFDNVIIEKKYLVIVDQLEELGNVFNERAMDLDNYWNEKMR